MKKIFILGNWKSNKTIAEAQAWRKAFEVSAPNVTPAITIIVCPAFHHLSVFEKPGNRYAVGVQDLSPFESGAYTGAIAADMVKDIATYAMIGHSERRAHFGETDELVAAKVKCATASGIRPIVCVSDIRQVTRLAQLAPEFAASGLILYEPLFAIGSGTSDTPENANSMAQRIHSILQVPILYGGSVVTENVQGFVRQQYLAGVGVGGASLDPVKFSRLIDAVGSS